MVIALSVISCINGGRLHLRGNKHKINNWENFSAGPIPEKVMTKGMVKKFINNKLIVKNSAKFRNWSPIFKGLMHNRKPKPMIGVWNTCVEVSSKDKTGSYNEYQVYFIKLLHDRVLETTVIPFLAECPAFNHLDPARFKE